MDEDLSKMPWVLQVVAVSKHLRDCVERIDGMQPAEDVVETCLRGELERLVRLRVWRNDAKRVEAYKKEVKGVV